MARLVRIRGFGAYFDICAYPPPLVHSSQQQRAAQFQQCWDTLGLGTPLCYLFNLIPDVDKIEMDMDANNINLHDREAHKAVTARFFETMQALQNTGNWTAGSFTMDDLYAERTDPSPVIKVF